MKSIQDGIVVPATRLQSGTWGLEEGDIAAAYTGDRPQKIRKPFEHEGRLWANWGGSSTEVQCTPLTLASIRNIALPVKQPHSHEGSIVLWKGRQYVGGPQHEFIAAPRGPGAEIDLTRRMFAYGGMFANSGTYRDLLQKWMADDRYTDLQRHLYAIEVVAPLPQTQEGMKALIEGEPNCKPTRPRFNAWTGQTAATL